MLSIVLLL